MPVAGAKFRDPYDYPSYQGGGAHGGTDFATAEGVKRGDNILAVLGGKVITVVENNGYSDYGNYVVVESSYNRKTYRFWYCHMLNKSSLTAGSQISQGTIVGKVGNTGYVLPPPPDGNHLHFEVRISPFAKANRISPKSLY
jgi:murein DD-endopeptidase MepM/ murein hydrolase activator NlpD